MPTLTFNQIIVIELIANSPSTFTVPSNCAWKIESAGVGGANGSIFLQNNANPVDKIAILFTSISNNDYASPLPFWLSPNFSGSFLNESVCKGSISITEFQIAP